MYSGEFLIIQKKHVIKYSKWPNNIWGYEAIRHWEINKHYDFIYKESPGRIYFRDRNKGKSKIPKFQIFVSFFDLIYIFVKNIFIKQKFYTKLNKTYNFDLRCNKCKNSFFSVNKKSSICLVCNNEQN